MAETSAGSNKKGWVDTRMLVTLIVAFLIIIALAVVFMKMKGGAPAGAISPSEFAKLDAEAQKLWKLDPNGSGWYVKA